MQLILRVANFTTEVWRNPKLGIAYLRRGVIVKTTAFPTSLASVFAYGVTTVV